MGAERRARSSRRFSLPDRCGKMALERHAGGPLQPLHNGNLRAVFESRERRIERIACRLRIGLTLVGAIADSITAILHGAGSVALMMCAVALAYVGTIGWLSFLIGRGHYRPWIKYATTTLDFALLCTLTVYWAHSAVKLPDSSTALAGTMIAFLPVVNLLSGLRVGRPIIAFSTACAVGTTLVIARLEGMHALVTAYYVGVVSSSGLLAAVISSTTTDLFVRFARRNELTRFLPRELVERVDRGELNLELGGTDQQVTVLMSDIRGFTTLSETRPPAQLVLQLNEYFTAMSQVIFEHGGTIDKYIGDAILAVFGIPEPGSDDAKRALAAARQMLRVLEGLNEDWRRRDMPLLRIGIGLHTGVAVAGNIGAPQRMEYTVIGDTVNVASRIEGLTKKYDTALLFSETTREAVGAALESSLVDEAEIRGRRGTVRLYTALG